MRSKGIIMAVAIEDNIKKWRAVLPNKKHEFSAGWRAAQKGGPAGWTTGRASGLRIKLGCRKERAGRLLFSAARTAIFRSPPAHPSLFCAAC